MRIQVLFAIALGLFPSVPSHADSEPKPSTECYDFAREIREGPANRKAVHLAGESNASGELPSGVVWAAAQYLTPRRVSEILQELATHEKTKSKRIDDMEITELKEPQFLRRQKIQFEVDPFPFISVKWTEDWAFNLLEGTREDPRHALVVYEKTEGTSHIKHLCGAYELHALPSGKTLLFLYEEANATSRSREDTLNGLTSTLAQFR